MPTHAQQQNASQQASSTKSTQPAAAVTGFGQLGFEAAEILNLQQSVGNHAVQRLLSNPASPITTRTAPPAVYRDPDPVRLTGLTVNHQLVTVPPTSGLSLAARPVPANASDVAYSLQAGSAPIAGGTSIDTSSGAITLSGSQTGGEATAVADQEIQVGDEILTSHRTVPFYMAGVPSGISGTTSSPTGSASLYGGQFWHTFSSPGGGQGAIERAHVNERFAAAGGARLALTGALGSVSVTVNNPDSVSAGWNLDSSGQMTGADDVDWGTRLPAGAFIARASNPTPANPLPQALTASQEFRNLDYPGQTYGATVATVTHRRAYEERDGQIVAVTSVNGEEIVQDYVGPTVFRHATATPATLQATAPAAAGEQAPEGATSQIAVEVVGQHQAAQYWIQGDRHGCSVDRNTGLFTAGSEAGNVVVHAGSTGNYDAVTITITAPPTPESAEQSATEEQTPGAPQGGITSTLPMNI